MTDSEKSECSTFERIVPLSHDVEIAIGVKRRFRDRVRLYHAQERSHEFSGTLMRLLRNQALYHILVYLRNKAGKK